MSRPLIVAFALAGLLAALFPACAAAEFGFSQPPEIKILNAASEPFTQAGGHPDRMNISLGFNTKEGEVDGEPRPVGDGNPRDLVVEFPPGFLGDPLAVPACARRDFESSFFGNDCGNESRVGTVMMRLIAQKNQAGETEEMIEVPLFSVEPAPGRLAEFGTSFLSKAVFTMSVRPGDNGLTIEQRDMAQGFVFAGLEIELWGVPADHQSETTIPRRPFLSLPTRCDRGPVQATVRTHSWQEPEKWVSATGSTGLALSGCADVPFAPAISFGLGNREADSPSGVDLDLTLPQNSDPDGIVSSATKEASVTLPQGLSVSPGIAPGLTLCSEAALALGSQQPASCPPSSRVGTVELEGTQLRETLKGRVYLGESRPGERFRLFLVAEGLGINAKVVGALRVDPATGQITATLRDLPEISIGRIGLHFDGGPQALLTTPLTCGNFTATGTFDRYGESRIVRSSDTETVDRAPGGRPCAAPLPFAPAFSAGTTGDRAGQTSAFTLTLRRQSGEQLADRFTAVFPPGLTAGVGSLDVCAPGDAAAGTCGAGSRVGSVVAEVGSGESLATLGGDVYLTDSYRRAPFGLALVLHGALGPFDLGTMVTRAALRLDSDSGQISVETDSLPRVVEGVPIRFRTIGLDIDRPGFIRTPTSCAPMSVDASIRSVSGGTAKVSTPYVVRGCEKLRFAPRLSMGFTGGSQMRRGGRPGLQIRIRSRKGGTNLRGADIALPASLRQSAVARQAICARQDALEGGCPKSSRIGRASAETPLVRGSLSGPIHVVQPKGDGPPELWTSLEAEGVSFEVRSKLSIRDGRVHTSLVGLPDAQIGQLALNLQGGEHGLVAFESDPCSRRERRRQADVAFEGQNRAYLIAHETIDRPRCAPSASARSGAPGRGEARGG